ncbi:DUF6894 family protein [Methylobacterium soli]|uniref:DUF6894 domain-containing protein n=1 Tax=Methylobacterium soli TaxID=553447 RepID=A0A6L3SR69_9HYPH|nr:hypothetical protein [Methylobacterium soli]KAB1070790.1 hypothetical protein F6X53_29635 [Methylobacterium soli]GJE44019.1 hypothetical protein AEGHOMDF_3205 [Methylobacterium soli]
MTLYHFHLRTAGGLERDETGMIRPDLETAYLDVCRTIPALMTEMVREGHDPAACAFEIRDGADQLLMEVPFLERVAKRPKSRHPATPTLSPETQALFNQLDLLALAINREVTRLHDNMGRAYKQVARMRETQSNLLWSFQTWSER